tara:strand:+ start:651 stop:3617 length:2967 start_codon:yes stop_codon:yes gene_type:complete
MASELLKNKALIQRLKEPEVPVVKFNLGDTGFEELITLPEPKPQELLDIQEENRKGRLLDTLNKIGGGLMDESVDFIKREELQFGGGPKGQQAGTEAAKLLTDAKRLKLVEYFKDLEKYIETNATKYSDVDKFFKDAIKEFDTPKYKDFIINSAQTQRNVRDPKPLGKIFDLKPAYKEGATFNYKNLFGLKGADASSKVRYVKDMMLINMMEKNPKMINMRDNIVKVLNNDILDLSEADLRNTKVFQKQNLKATAARPNLLRSYFNSIIKDFESKRIKVKDVSKGVEAELQNVLKKKDISDAFRKKVRTTLNNIYKSKKYGIQLRNEFKDLFGKDKPIYSPTVKKGQERFEFEHKIGKASTAVNKLPSTYMLRGEYVPSSFNYAKNINFDSKLIDLMNEYKETKSAATETKIKNLYKDFNKKSAGYLKNLTLDFDRKAGAVVVTDNTPIFKIKNYGDYKQQFAKNLKHSQAYLSTVKDGKFAFDKDLFENFLVQNQGQKKLTAFQELINRKGAGVDPSLLMKAGFEEFVKPAAKIGARGAATIADLAISAGPGLKGLGVGLLLEADPIITGMSEGKTFGQTARDTFVGSAIDAIPGVNLGSLNEDLLKLADTEEQKVGVQNVIDYQRDADRFKKRFENYKYLEDNPFEAEGVDLIAMEKGLMNDYLDLQFRKPKVQNPDVFSLLRELATKEAKKRKENLETGIAGKIFGDFALTNPNFVEDKIQQIMAASTGVQGATDSYADVYKFLPQEQLTPDELDERFDMEGGIMAADGGRIGFADGPIDPKRRLFLKIMGGIASLPVFGKFLGKSEVAKPIVKVAGSSTKMPNWFPDLINKVMFGGTGKRVDADLTVYEPKELPGISIGRYDDGRVFVEGQNEYGKKYMIEYEPPGFELIDEKTGKAVKKPGEFIAQEEVPVNVDPDGNADFDVEVLDDLDQILGPDTRAMEEFATGKKIKDMKSGEVSVGQAEARAEQAADEAAELEVFDEID